MARVDKSVFISYRRTNFWSALAIYQDLTQHGFDVFFDYTGIASGDFESVILDNIRSRAHFLVLLTPSALERCGEPGDWLRREIETALESKRNVVPLILEGFDFGTPTIARQLIGTLEPLKHYNALKIVPDYFEAAMDRLRDRYLRVALDSVPHPASFSAQQGAAEQKVAAASAPKVSEEEMTAEQWFERGVDAADPDEEIRFYDYAIRLKGDFPEALNNRGLARSVKGDWDRAIEDYDAALRLKPDYVFAINNRAIALANKGDLDRAIQNWSEAVRLDPRFATVLNNRGFARAQKGDWDGAIEDCNEAIGLEPNYANAFDSRGFARHHRGDLEGALQDFNEAIRLRPDFPDAFYNRGVTRSAKGDLNGAIADYSEAIRLKPDFAQAFSNRALARRANGDEPGALQDFAEAERLENSQSQSASNSP